MTQHLCSGTPAPPHSPHTEAQTLANRLWNSLHETPNLRQRDKEKLGKKALGCWKWTKESEAGRLPWERKLYWNKRGEPVSKPAAGENSTHILTHKKWENIELHQTNSCVPPLSLYLKLTSFTQACTTPKIVCFVSASIEPIFQAAFPIHNNTTI